MNFQKQKQNALVTKSLVKKEASVDAGALQAVVGKVDDLVKSRDANIAIANEAARKGDAASAEAKDAIAKAEKQQLLINTLTEEVNDLKQRFATKVEKGEATTEGLESLLTKSDMYKAFAERKTNSFVLKAPMSSLNSNGTANTTLIPSARGPLQLDTPLTNNFFARLKRLDTQGSNLYEYTKEVVATSTNGGKFVTDTEAGDESLFTFEHTSKQLKLVRTWTEMTSELIRRAPAVVEASKNRLVWFLNDKADRAMLLGNGVGANVTGLFHTSEHAVYTPVAGDTPVDSILRAQGQAFLTGIASNVVLLNPIDLTAIKLSKNGQGEYLITSPTTGGVITTLWGMEVMPNTNIPVGKFAIGNIDAASGRVGDDNVELSATDSHGNNFTAGIVTLNAQISTQYIGFRPASWLIGDLKAA